MAQKPSDELSRTIAALSRAIETVSFCRMTVAQARDQLIAAEIAAQRAAEAARPATAAA